MRIGIIGSSGGSVVRELIGATGSAHDFSIVTDRPCGLESLAEEFAIPHLRIVEPDNSIFSQHAKRFFDQQEGVELILLFYLRLVTSDLFNTYPTFNIHPSLLPDYRGLNAIERAHADQVERFGATLHLVDAKADHGPIVAQISTSLQPGESVEQMRRISFAQKTYLVLYLLDRCGSAPDRSCLSSLQHQAVPMNPPLKSELFREYYHRFVIREGLERVL